MTDILFGSFACPPCFVLCAWEMTRSFHPGFRRRLSMQDDASFPLERQHRMSSGLLLFVLFPACLVRALSDRCSRLVVQTLPQGQSSASTHHQPRLVPIGCGHAAETLRGPSGLVRPFCACGSSLSFVFSASVGFNSTHELPSATTSSLP